MTEIDHFVQTYNKTARPFAWTATAGSILAKIAPTLRRYFRDVTLGSTASEALPLKGAALVHRASVSSTRTTQAKRDTALNPFGFIVSFSIHAVRDLSSRSIF